ncbi:class I SAM-dependent methyltransferase, partial [Bacillus vallismortis]|nr:class I SAM-dependent methyltransferase [Bacillus vallismortis]
VGKLFAKRYKEYSWLQESARVFPGMKELAGLFEEAGLKNVKYHSFTGGVAATHIGWK